MKRYMYASIAAAVAGASIYLGPSAFADEKVEECVPSPASSERERYVWNGGNTDTAPDPDSGDWGPDNSSGNAGGQHAPEEHADGVPYQVGQGEGDGGNWFKYETVTTDAVECPEPSPEPSPDPTPEATPEVTPEPSPEVTPEPSVEPSPDPTPAPPTPGPFTPEPSPDPSPAPPLPPGPSATCDDLGIGNIPSTSPLYTAELDADGDGVACEEDIPDLPKTGADDIMLAGMGAGLIGAGAATAWAARRRK